MHYFQPKIGSQRDKPNRWDKLTKNFCIFDQFKGYHNPAFWVEIIQVKKKQWLGLFLFSF